MGRILDERGREMRGLGVFGVHGTCQVGIEVPRPSLAEEDVVPLAPVSAWCVCVRVCVCVYALIYMR